MIYCVEDDRAIRDLMIYTLRASGFEAMGFENDSGFWTAMKEQRPEMILLDVMLPGEDGLTILRKPRSSLLHRIFPSLWPLQKTASTTKSLVWIPVRTIISRKRLE